MGRRWGKSTLGGDLVMNVLRHHGKSAWIVPTYKNSRPLWRWVQRVCGPLVPAGLVDVSKSELVVTTHLGGFFGIYSGDSIDGIRGESFDLAVLDEAARISESARVDAIQPTLADRDGDEIDISTPRRKNWFYLEFKGADGGRTAAWRAPSSANPNPNIRRAYELARTKVAAKTFRQEWNAEFVEDGGEVFRNVAAQAVLKRADPVEGHQYVFGLDWGRTNDYTVVVVFDAGTKQMVDMDRFNDTGYGLQLVRLAAMHDKWHPSMIMAEANSMGGPMVERLQGLGYPVQPFWTTNPLKTQIINDLALGLETGQIGLLDDPDLLTEFEAYEEQKTPTGLLTFNAPTGMHDDIVMGAALGWNCISVPIQFF